MSAAPVFLLGGTPAHAVYGAEFVAAAGETGANIVALVQNETGWQRYQKIITTPWLERGVTQIDVAYPDENGVLDVESVLEKLDQATGIFIGGGKTPVYYQHYATGAIRDLLIAKHVAGVPVAGISAGALLAMEFCQFGAEETADEQIHIRAGLGLARGFVIGVHFTEWNALSEVLEVMNRTGTSIGLGIDEPACVICQNGQPVKILGKDVYKIELGSFENCEYHVKKLEQL